MPARNNCSEELLASKKYIFWIITYSEEELLLRGSYTEKVFVFKK